eukprot:3125703-Rhodomonas_salina.2
MMRSTGSESTTHFVTDSCPLGVRRRHDSAPLRRVPLRLRLAADNLQNMFETETRPGHANRL